MSIKDKGVRWRISKSKHFKNDLHQLVSFNLLFNLFPLFIFHPEAMAKKIRCSCLQGYHYSEAEKAKCRSRRNLIQQLSDSVINR